MTWSTSSDGGHRLRGRVMSGWSRRRSRLVATGMTLGLSAVLLGVTPVPVAQASNRVDLLPPRLVSSTAMATARRTSRSGR